MVRPEAETGEALSTHRPASLPHTLANNGKPEMRMRMRPDQLYTLTERGGRLYTYDAADE